MAAARGHGGGGLAVRGLGVNAVRNGIDPRAVRRRGGVNDRRRSVHAARPRGRVRVAKVDALAAKVGVKGDDPRRLRGAVQSVVSERHGEGHTATPTSIAADIAADKLGGNHELAVKIMATIDEGVEAGRFRRAVDEATGAAWLATGWGWLCEMGIWKALVTSRELNP